MTVDTKDMLNSILSSIARIDYIKPDDIPNIQNRLHLLMHRQRQEKCLDVFRIG